MSPWWRRVAETWHPIFRSVTCSNTCMTFFHGDFGFKHLPTTDRYIYIYIQLVQNQHARYPCSTIYSQKKDQLTKSFYAWNTDFCSITSDDICWSILHENLPIHPAWLLRSSRDTSHCRIGMHLQKSGCAWSFFWGSWKMDVCPFFGHGCKSQCLNACWIWFAI